MTARHIDFLDPVEHRTLPESVADQLRELIVTLVLPPGAKISEKALCERLQVSRTPFREAMRVLAGEGLVVITPRRGFRIATVTKRDIDEAFPILGALEALAAELACQRINNYGVALLRHLQERMERAHDEGDREEYFKLNEQIHKTIRDACGNQTLVAMMASFSTRVRRARYMANLSAERWNAAVEEHEEMLAALEARDGPALARLMKAHIANKHAALLDALEGASGLAEEE